MSMAGNEKKFDPLRNPISRNGDIIYINTRRMSEFLTTILSRRTKPFILVSHGHTDPSPHPTRLPDEAKLLEDPRYLGYTSSKWH